MVLRSYSWFCAQGALLAVLMVLGNELGLVVCKIRQLNALNPVLSLWPVFYNLKF